MLWGVFRQQMGVGAMRVVLDKALLSESSMFVEVGVLWNRLNREDQVRSDRLYLLCFDFD